MTSIDVSNPQIQSPSQGGQAVFLSGYPPLGTDNGNPFKPLQDVDPDGVLPDDPSLVGHRFYWGRFYKARRWSPGHRVSSVCGHSASKLVEIKVVQGPKVKNAYYEGTLSCGSVWVCPRCAKKIARKKRARLDTIFSTHQKVFPGASVLSLTLTVAHHAGESLKSVMDRLNDFQKFVMEGGRGLTQSLKAGGLKCLGSYSVLEITHGGSGWHPHKHFALFLNSAFSPEQVAQLEAALRQRAAGSGKGHRDDLNFIPEHAISLRPGIAGGYLSKWGLSEELSLSTSKHARNSGNRTPFELLDADDSRSKLLWEEYIQATKGIHQSHCSSQLVKNLGIQLEESDEDLAAEPETGPDPVIYVLPLSHSEYTLINRKKAHADVLYAAATWGSEAVFHILTSLGGPPEHSRPGALSG